MANDGDDGSQKTERNSSRMPTPLWPNQCEPKSSKKKKTNMLQFMKKANNPTLQCVPNKAKKQDPTEDKNGKKDTKTRRWMHRAADHVHRAMDKCMVTRDIVNCSLINPWSRFWPWFCLISPCIRDVSYEENIPLKYQLQALCAQISSTWYLVNNSHDCSDQIPSFVC